MAAPMVSAVRQAVEAERSSRVFRPPHVPPARFIAGRSSKRLLPRSNGFLAAHVGKSWIPAADCAVGKSTVTMERTSHSVPGGWPPGRGAPLSNTHTRRLGRANDAVHGAAEVSWRFAVLRQIQTRGR